jgi:ribose/xylose/arabinose/galactoside ABC-type transport system permease subunit
VTRRRASGSVLRALQPWIVLLVMVVALIVLPRIFGGTVSWFTVFTINQAFADFGLVALGLGLSMVIAEYDLSTAAVYALGGLLAIEAGGSSPVLGALLALGVGIVLGLAQGGIMTTTGLSSVPITLGGYLICAGLTSAIAHGKPVSYDNLDLGADLNRQILTVFSPRSLIVLGLFAVTAAVMRFTRVGSSVRAVGGDRRASRTAGLRVHRTVLGVMVASAALSSFGGALTSFAVASGAADVSVTPLIFGTIAAILGGVTLTGGRGTPLGIAAGALSLATLNQTLAIIGAADYLSSIITALLLLLVTVLTAPDLLRSPLGRLRRVRRRPLMALPTPTGQEQRHA